jgi:SAM-dependent methyltransferase
MSFIESARHRLPQLTWEIRGRAFPGGCPVCGGDSKPRTAYHRLFRECTECGFIWCHDTPERANIRGMGLQGSWGGPERGGERDDFLVRFLNEQVPVRRKILVYGAGTTLVFRVLLDEGFDVMGADVSHQVVEYRTREFPGRFVHASELESSRHNFDIITACEVFEHFHDPMRWIGSIVHNLAPDGVLCGCTNFYPGHGPIEDGQKVGYMSLDGHVAYWSESSLAAAVEPFGMASVAFEMICPGSVKPDRTFNDLFQNKRLFFASRDEALIERLRALRRDQPILPCDTSDYPIAAYRD